MPYEYLDDGVTADITVRVRAGSLDELFKEAADATVNAMIEGLDSIRASIAKSVAIDEKGLDLLLLKFLDEIVFYKDAEGLILRAHSVAIVPTGGRYHLQGDLRGELIDPVRHVRLADVKAVTLFGLSVEAAGSGWQAEITLDV